MSSSASVTAESDYFPLDVVITVVLSLQTGFSCVKPNLKRLRNRELNIRLACRMIRLALLVCKAIPAFGIGHCAILGNLSRMQSACGNLRIISRGKRKTFTFLLSSPNRTTARSCELPIGWKAQHKSCECVHSFSTTSGPTSRRQAIQHPEPAQNTYDENLTGSSGWMPERKLVSPCG